MPQSKAAPLLKKLGEHGLGTNVLVISSSKFGNEKLIFEQKIDKKWKLQYFTFNIDDDYKEITEKFINTINYYSYINNLILDYQSFLLLVENLAKTHYLNTMLNKLIIYNPVSSEKRKDILANKFLNLFGERVLNKGFGDNNQLFSQIQYLYSKTVYVFAEEDKNFCLKLSANIKNSNLELSESHFESIEKISILFD